MRPIVLEFWIQYSPHIFEQYGLRITLFGYPHGLREQVAVVQFSQLLPGNRERRTGDATSQQIDLTHKVDGAKFFDIVFNHIPFRPILS